VSPPDSDIASSSNGDENLIQRGFDGIGSFFNNLFGGGSATATPYSSSGRRDKSSENDRRFFPDENDRRYGAIDDMTVDAMPYVPMPPPSPVPPPRPQASIEPPSGNIGSARTNVPPPQTTVRDLHSGTDETYVFRNGDTGQTFTYRRMPGDPATSSGNPGDRSSSYDAPPRQDRYAYGGARESRPYDETPPPPPRYRSMPPAEWMPPPPPPLPPPPRVYDNGPPAYERDNGANDTYP
jgi:hypothetical protein